MLIKLRKLKQELKYANQTKAKLFKNLQRRLWRSQWISNIDSNNIKNTKEEYKVRGTALKAFIEILHMIEHYKGDVYEKSDDIKLG
jgi:hypothetical protein